MPSTVQSVDGNKIRELILDESFRAHVGHVGCSIGVADILAVLYEDFLLLPTTKSTLRDHFILSKGHAALGMYAALFLKGIITHEQFTSYHTDGSQIGTHPEYGVAGVELATGSLGQGIGVAAGIALAKKMKDEKTKTVVLLSDAECNEGSVWEAIAFSSHHKLPLIAIVDVDGQQGFGYTQDVLRMDPFEAKWEAFGWTTYKVNGHDDAALKKALKNCEKNEGPSVLLADTTLGKGISFMEGKVDWHYLPLSQDQYAQARNELNATSTKKKGTGRA